MKGQWSKLFVVTVAIVLLAGACAAPPPPPTPIPVPPTPTPDPAAPVHAWADAINNGDAEAALALVSDDVKWQGSFEATGKEQLRAVVDWMIGIELKPQIKDCQPQDDRVVCNLTAPDGCKAAFGASSLRSKLVFDFQPDGKVQQASLEPDGEEWAGYWSWLEAEMAWAAANRAEEHAKVGTAPNQREAGSIQIKLCKEYAESLKATPVATSDLTAPVQAWVDALNSGDVDATLALFTDDLKFDVFEYHARNKDELRGIFDWLAGLETKYQIKECQTKEDRVVCTMPGLDACIAGYDPANGLASTMTFVPTQDGKIAQVNGVVDGFDDYYAKWISPAMAWMRANRAEELAKAESTSDGREAGAINAKLCKEYGESLKVTPTPTPAAAADPLPIIKAYEEAVNRHDVDAVAALFADQAIYMLSGGAVGRDEIREFENWQAGLNKRLEFTDCKTEGNTVTCKGFVTDDCEKAVGGLGVRLDEVTFKVNDGKIQNVYGSASDVDSRRSDENGTLMIVWAQSNRPEDYAKYINPTKAGHTARQNGQLFLQMCLQAAKAPLFLVELWGAAFNRDDLDGVMGLFVDNGLSFTMGEISGDNQVARDTLEYIKGFNGKFDITDCKAEGQQAVCALAMVDDYCVKAEGLKTVNYQAMFKFKDNKIQTLDAKMTAADASAVSAFGDKLGAWATANRPDGWKKYQDPAAAGITPRQNGELVATLCKGYLDNQK